jgi:hypothetical protein
MRISSFAQPAITTQAPVKSSENHLNKVPSLLDLYERLDSFRRNPHTTTLQKIEYNGNEYHIRAADPGLKSLEIGFVDVSEYARRPFSYYVLSPILHYFCLDSKNARIIYANKTNPHGCGIYFNPFVTIDKAIEDINSENQNCPHVVQAQEALQILHKFCKEHNA